MKQYTTQDQTAQLIELGFEKPKFSHRYWRDNELVINNNYSIGELIEMLPRTIKNYYDLSILSTLQGWWVLYGMISDGDMWSVERELYRGELIDALYEMIIKLKEEKLI